MKRTLLLMLGFVVSAWIGQVDALGLEPLPSESLPAPVQISPTDQARLHGFPRRVVFEWSNVPGAKWYGIEIDYYGAGWSSQEGRPTHIVRVKNPTLTFDFVGNQPGSWRVWAIDKKERPGQVSAWSMFTFGPDNQLIPQPSPNTAPRTQLPPEEQAPLPQGKLREPPVFDPKTGEACGWPSITSRGPGITMPKAIYTPEPDYPDGARADKANGGVKLAVDLGEDGLVKRVCLLSASRDDLGRQALDTVRTWRFKPAQKDGAPIPSNLQIEVAFHIGR